MSKAPERIEAIAKEVYVAMTWAAHCGPPPDGVVPPWSDRGNSHGQTEARAAARLIADLIPDPAAIRAEALEEAARVADRAETEFWEDWKERADPHDQGKSDGATEVAARLRALAGKVE